jgi:hypothetical protein
MEMGVASAWRPLPVLVGGDWRELFPVPGRNGTLPHDGALLDGRLIDITTIEPKITLVVSSCDPAIGILAAEFAWATDFRMLVLAR